MNEASTAVELAVEGVFTPGTSVHGAFEHALTKMKQLAELVTKASQEVTTNRAAAGWWIGTARTSCGDRAGEGWTLTMTAVFRSIR